MEKICKNCKYRDTDPEHYEKTNCDNEFVLGQVDSYSYDGTSYIDFSEDFGCIYWEKP